MLQHQKQEQREIGFVLSFLLVSSFFIFFSTKPAVAFMYIYFYGLQPQPVGMYFLN